MAGALNRIDNKNDTNGIPMFINGPAGPLEAALDCAPNEKTVTAVLCHPHPQYGGSMHDAVLQSAAEVLLANGVNCLRFNFRGVGDSAGSFDHGNGETDDLLAVINWQREEYPRDKLWLCGYSFGANVVWRALSTANPQRAVLIAPPVGMMEFGPAPDAVEHLDAIAGDRDDFVDKDKFNDWAGINSHVIAGADHFFSAGHEDLKETLAAIFKS